VKQCGIERYKDFLITSSAVPTLQRALSGIRRAIFFAQGRLGSIVEVKRIEGPIFNSKEAGEEHGLKLCKEWIDKRP
jgi:hypothetical protein